MRREKTAFRLSADLLSMVASDRWENEKKQGVEKLFSSKKQGASEDPDPHPNLLIMLV